MPLLHLLLPLGDLNIRPTAQEPEVKDLDQPFTGCAEIKEGGSDRKKVGSKNRMERKIYAH